MTDHATALKQAADKYRRAQKRADELVAEPRRELTEAMRAAYSDEIRIADILRYADHVWSRTWVEKAVKDDGDSRGDSGDR